MIISLISLIMRLARYRGDFDSRWIHISREKK